MKCENPEHFGTYIDRYNVLRCSAKHCWIKQLPPKRERERLAKKARKEQKEKVNKDCLKHHRQMQQEFPEQAAADKENTS